MSTLLGPGRMAYVYATPLITRRQVAIADLGEGDGDGGSVVEITRINVPRDMRGQGHGSRLLRRILDDADRFGVSLVLWPHASRSRNTHGRLVGLTQEQLLAWYRRHGFVTEAGQLALRMRREPRS